MITVDEAIKRAGQTWSVHRTNTEADTAFQDRTLLAAEVVAMREALAECEREVETLRAVLLEDDDEAPF